MKVRTRVFILAAFSVLLALAGCGRGMLFQGERPAWRHEAEAQCLQSGAVKIGYGVTEAKPIEGPGMCGMDYPLKVSALGESSTFAYTEVPRPPVSVGSAPAADVPNWPPTQARYTPMPPAQGLQQGRNKDRNCVG